MLGPVKNKTFLLSYANDTTSRCDEEFEKAPIVGYSQLFNNLKEIYAQAPPRRTGGVRTPGARRAAVNPDIHTHPPHVFRTRDQLVDEREDVYGPDPAP